MLILLYRIAALKKQLLSYVTNLQRGLKKAVALNVFTSMWTTKQLADICFCVVYVLVSLYKIAWRSILNIICVIIGILQHNYLSLYIDLRIDLCT